MPELDLLRLAHQTIFGGIAAAGFGVLFNVRLSSLGWCLIAGALGLLVRDVASQVGWWFESATFGAACVVGFVAHASQGRATLPPSALAVCGCIPMVPGSFAAKLVLGLLALTAPEVSDVSGQLEEVVRHGLRVVFTVGALGAGIALSTGLLSGRLGRR